MMNRSVLLVSFIVIAGILLIMCLQFFKDNKKCEPMSQPDCPKCQACPVCPDNDKDKRKLTPDQMKLKNWSDVYIGG